MELKEESINYTIEPWQSQEEFINFYEILFGNKEKSETKLLNQNNVDNIHFFSNTNNLLDKYIQSLSLQNLKQSMKYLIKWDTRGDNKMFCLPIILLVNTLIKIKENKINNKDINSCHILAEVLIRVINIIMDQLRKSKKAVSLNMYLIAKDLELPEFIIDIRHSSTHKNLPSFNELLFAVEYMFYWIKIKLIEPKYNYFIKEKKNFIFLIKQINNNENIFLEQNKLINKCAPTSLEPDHLLTIITHLFVNIKNNFEYNSKNNKISYDKNSNNMNNKILLFKKILDKEKEIFILMIFSFVYQQIVKINENKEIKKEKKYKYKQYILFFIKIIGNNIPKDIEFDLKKCEILYLSVYNNIKKLKIESKTKEYDSILELFMNIFKEFNKNINHENEDIFKENLGNLRKNIDYVDLDSINGNISTINVNVDNIIDNEDEKESSDINEQIAEKDIEKNKMEIEEDINTILNKEITDNYNNYNSIII